MLIVNILLITFILAIIDGCSNNQPDQNVTTIGNNIVQLTTGDGNNQITWTIEDVKRTNNYLKPDLSYVPGDSLLIRGEAKTNSMTGPFLQNGLPAFILEDEHGQEFTMQAVIADKGVPEDSNGTLVSFQVYFLLSNDGSFNQSIETSKNLIISDPIPANRSISHHSNNLSSFNISK